MRWIVGSSHHGCWLGIAYPDMRRALLDVLQPGMRFVDVGAHAGHFTLIGSRAVGPSGRVLAVEPAPRSLGYLRQHIDMNGLANVDVVDVAISDRTGQARFTTDPGSLAAHLSDDGAEQVATTTLDDLVASWGAGPPGCVKLNIEGAELEALRGAERTLAEARPVLLVATHGDELHEQCLDVLRDHDYRAELVGTLEVEAGGFLHRTILARPA
jgi:FkbM family methyltransferase